LNAVIRHVAGRQKKNWEGGHYVAWVRTCLDIWVCCNDTKVTKIDNPVNAKDLDNEGLPYVLIYTNDEVCSSPLRGHISDSNISDNNANTITNTTNDHISSTINTVKIEQWKHGKFQDNLNQLSVDHGEDSVGIVIAGNAGLPGGSVAYQIRSAPFTVLEGKYSTQEESLTSWWLNAALQQLYNDNPNLDAMDETIEDLLERLYDNALGKTFRQSPSFQINDISHNNIRPWGMVESMSLRPDTIQQINFQSSFDPTSYNFCYLLDVKPWIECSQQQLLLGYVYGPNISATGLTATGSTSRTYVNGYKHDKHYNNFFKPAVTMAISAALTAFDKQGIQIVLLPVIAGGLYSAKNPHTNHALHKDYFAIVQSVVANSTFTHIRHIYVNCK
jgi:hypothetical protein